MSVKQVYIKFAVALVITLVILVTMVGCVKKEEPQPQQNVNPGVWNTTLLTEIDGCQVYFSTSPDGHRGFYSSKCPAGQQLNLK